MLATLLIEFVFAFYVLWRYKRTTLTKLVVIMLVCLGVFQLAEYMICGGLGLDGVEWTRLGYISITLLPALGLHIVATLAKARIAPLLLLAYLNAAAFVLYFAFAEGAVSLHQCAPNYAVFDMSRLTTFLYGLYYYGWLLLTIALATYWARKKPKTTPALRWTVVGYASFIIPTTIANLVDPATLGAIPSIMCGFAILLAFILVWRVMPLSGTPLARSSTKRNNRKKR